MKYAALVHYKENITEAKVQRRAVTIIDVRMGEKVVFLRFALPTLQWAITFGVCPAHFVVQNVSSSA